MDTTYGSAKCLAQLKLGRLCLCVLRMPNQALLSLKELNGRSNKLERKAYKSRYLGYYVLSFVLTLVVFAPWLNNWFTSDDWLVISRNMQVSWPQIPGWFISMRSGWYRPLFEAFVVLCWRLFGLNPLGYRLLSVILYALISANIGIIMYLLAREHSIAILTTIMFCTFASHAEPVVWFAATNELLAAFFVSISFMSYLVFRKTNNAVWLGTTVLSWCLAITSKETASSFPFILIAYDLLLAHDTRDKLPLLRILLPPIAIALLGAVFILLRLLQGSPYSVIVTVPRLVMNLVFYILISGFALPNNYAYIASLPLWRTSPSLPIFVLLCSTSVIAVTLWIWLQQRDHPIIQKHTRALVFSVVWAVSMLAPVVSIVAERTALLPSIGIVMALSLLFVQAWKCIKDYNKQLARGLAVLVVLYIGANVLTLEYRCAWWGKASEVSVSLFEQLNTHINDTPIDNEVVLVNLPDHLEYAYMFRNAFPEAATVLNYKHNIRAILDTDLGNLTSDQHKEYMNQLRREPLTSVFWYEGGALILDR